MNSATINEIAEQAIRKSIRETEATIVSVSDQDAQSTMIDAVKNSMLVVVYDWQRTSECDVALWGATIDAQLFRLLIRVSNN